jgi:hypothetical protein
MQNGYAFQKSSRLGIAGATLMALAIGASALAIAQQWGITASGSQLGMPQYMTGQAQDLVALGDKQRRFRR